MVSLSIIISVGVTGLVRIAITYHHPKNHETILSQVISQLLDAMIENILTFALWVRLQLAIAVICCCSPTYWPLLPEPISSVSSEASFTSSLSLRDRGTQVC